MQDTLNANYSVVGGSLSHGRSACQVVAQGNRILISRGKDLELPGMDTTNNARSEAPNRPMKRKREGLEDG